MKKRNNPMFKRSKVVVCALVAWVAYGKQGNTSQDSLQPNIVHLNYFESALVASKSVYSSLTDVLVRVGEIREEEAHKQIFDDLYNAIPLDESPYPCRGHLLLTLMDNQEHSETTEIVIFFKKHVIESFVGFKDEERTELVTKNLIIEGKDLNLATNELRAALCMAAINGIKTLYKYKFQPEDCKDIWKTNYNILYKLCVKGQNMEQVHSGEPQRISVIHPSDTPLLNALETELMANQLPIASYYRS